MKSAVEDLLSEMDLDKSAFRLGNSQVSGNRVDIMHLALASLILVYDRTGNDRTETEQQNFTETEPKPNRTVY